MSTLRTSAPAAAMPRHVVLLAPYGDPQIPAGRVLRLPALKAGDLIDAKSARAATATDIELAGPLLVDHAF